MPDAVGPAAEHHAGRAEAEHRQRVRERRIRARDAELLLHRGQRDDDRPHAHAADRRQHEREREAAPGLRGVDGGRGHGGQPGERASRSRAAHGAVAHR